MYFTSQLVISIKYAYIEDNKGRSTEYAEWYKAKVSIGYHIEMDNHFYSIPFQLIHERLDIRMTASVMEAFDKGERVAAHVRSYIKGGYTTVKEHMPLPHRYYAEWNPTRFIQWAGKIWQATSQLVERILSRDKNNVNR